MSRFSQLMFAQPIEVFDLRDAYNCDSNESKVDLGFGFYRDDSNGALVLPMVRQVEKIMAQDDTLNKEALPVLGLKSFTAAAAKMLLGSDSLALLENRTCSAQVLSITGGLYVAASFLCGNLGYDTFCHSMPISYNHCKLVFESAGFKHERLFRYWSQANRAFDVEGLLEDLREAPPNSVVFLQMCAHNPTGIDPNREQWKAIADVMEERNLFPFIDCSNIGLASGDIDQDAWPVRYFVSRRLEFVTLLTLTKNFGLYSERIGNLTFVVNDSAHIHKIESELTLIILGMYNSPPEHGARIVAYILNDQQLFNEWRDFLRKQCKHVMEMRKALRDALERLTTPGTWSHITSQVGMFSYTGLNEIESLYLREYFHIYLLRCGRINMCGINHNNVDRIAEAIHKTVGKSALNIA